MKDNYLANIAREIRAINEANGFNLVHAPDWDLQNKIPAIIALIHSEVSEALEEFRDDNKEKFFVEMADVIIRVLDCTGGFPDIDMKDVIAKKLEKNRKRSFRHGGKKV